MPANLENSAVARGLEKVSFHSSPKERQCQRMLKLVHNCTISYTSKVMLKILQVRLQQTVNCELPDVQASGPITSWQIDGETMETVRDLILGCLQNHCRW